MSGYKNLNELVTESYTNGKNWYTVFNKTPQYGSAQGYWSDMSALIGTPRPNYKTGTELCATAFIGERGIYHGCPITPGGHKFLHKLMIGTNSSSVAPATFMLCDYLLYYPFVDMDVTEYQQFTNAINLPRYVDGSGVMAFLVAGSAYTGGYQCQITYTNQDGVTGRNSLSSIINTYSTVSILVTCALGGSLGRRGPFFFLQGNDTGIRSVDGITIMGACGGYAALVLVKPLATLVLTTPLCVSETDFLIDSPSLPRIFDGAYLNLLINPNGSIFGAPIFGELTVIWR